MLNLILCQSQYGSLHPPPPPHPTPPPPHPHHTSIHTPHTTQPPWIKQTRQMHCLVLSTHLQPSWVSCSSVLHPSGKLPSHKMYCKGKVMSLVQHNLHWLHLIQTDQSKWTPDTTREVKHMLNDRQLKNPKFEASTYGSIARFDELTIHLSRIFSCCFLICLLSAIFTGLHLNPFHFQPCFSSVCLFCFCCFGEGVKIYAKAEHLHVMFMLSYPSHRVVQNKIQDASGSVSSWLTSRAVCLQECDACNAPKIAHLVLSEAKLDLKHHGKWFEPRVSVGMIVRVKVVLKERLLLLTDVSTNWAVVIFRVKWRVVVRWWYLCLWSWFW